MNAQSAGAGTSRASGRLDQKVAIVTGGGRGIGKAIVRLFAEEGAKVVVGYLQSEREAGELARELVAEGREAVAVRVDVSKSGDVKRLVERTVSEFGRVDILVNNAGIIFRKGFLESTEEDWDRTVDINLKGVYLCCREVAPIMLRQKEGKIVNISSISGISDQTSAILAPDYVAAKAGVVGLTRSLAAVLAPHVNVNAVCPGATDTDMIHTLPKEALEARLRETPLGRLGRPEEMAGAVLFLSSGESDYVTGEVLIVSGGRTMG